MIRINAAVHGVCELPAIPEKSMLIKILFAAIIKLAIVVAAIYWFWPTPKPVTPPQRVDSSIVLPQSG